MQSSGFLRLASKASQWLPVAPGLQARVLALSRVPSSSPASQGDPRTPREWWYCQCPGPWASSGCLPAEAVPSRATSDPACWDCVETPWQLWVGCPVGCRSPGNCSSAGVEASLVHQSFCFISPAMGYFESLWITLRLCQCLWIFINNKCA